MAYGKRAYSSWGMASMNMPCLARAMVAAGLILNTGPVRAAPLPPNPTLWREVTYSSYEEGGSIRLPQFDPAKGMLTSARAVTTGNATFSLTPQAPITKPTPYAFKVGYYIYYGPRSFHLFLNGSETLAPSQPSYSVTAAGNGSEPVTGAALDPLKGKGTLGLTFSSDLPQPAAPGPFALVKARGTVSITYRYVPTLKLPKGGLPKPPINAASHR